MIKKLIIVVVIVGIGLFAYKNIPSNSTTQTSTASPAVQETKVIQTDTPQIVSTKPDPLDEAVVIPTQVVEISFNIPIENIGEFKYELTPKAKYKSKLSDDRKTVILTPEPTWPVGTTFTLNVSPLTKFDGGKRLKDGFIIHFKTIDYKGV